MYRWLELARPNVFVLTDGSGRTGHSRLASTSTVLASTQAHPAPIYGRFTDVEVYDLILRGDASALVALMRELATAFVRDGVGGVVGDALEGFNPSHDLCRFLINGAVLLVREETGRDVLNFAFPLDGPPDGSALQAGTSSVRIDLDAAALTRKLESASNYAALQSEVASAVSRFGTQAFATEWLHPVLDPLEGLTRMREEPPQYERFGKGRVTDGFYAETIGYRTHVRPLIQNAWRQAGLDLGATA
ncbi:MAG: hypothetical protein ABMA15_01920 [Vicinamibacterales bacterium]